MVYLSTRAVPDSVPQPLVLVCMSGDGPQCVSILIKQASLAPAADQVCRAFWAVQAVVDVAIVFVVCTNILGSA